MAPNLYLLTKVKSKTHYTRSLDRMAVNDPLPKPLCANKHDSSAGIIQTLNSGEINGKITL